MIIAMTSQAVQESLELAATASSKLEDGINKPPILGNLNASLSCMENLTSCLTSICKHSEFFATELIKMNRLVSTVVNGINSLTMSASVLFSLEPREVKYLLVDLQKQVRHIYDVRGALFVLLRLLLLVSDSVEVVDLPLCMKHVRDKLRSTKQEKSFMKAIHATELEGSTAEFQEDIDLHNYLTNIYTSVKRTNTMSELGYYRKLCHEASLVEKKQQELSRGNYRHS